MVESARLESVYTLIAYRGFESLPLRQFAKNRLSETGVLLQMPRLSGFPADSGVPGHFSSIPRCARSGSLYGRPLEAYPSSAVATLV